MWCRMAEAAGRGLASGEDGDFYHAKLEVGRFFMARVLPRHSAHFQAVIAGGETLMGLPAEAF